MTFAQKYGPWALVAGASDGVGAAFAEGLGFAGVLAGPCRRGLMPGERALNVDLLGAPSPEEVLPNWLRRLEVAPAEAIPPAPVAPSPAPTPDEEGPTAEEPLVD